MKKVFQILILALLVFSMAGASMAADTETPINEGHPALSSGVGATSVTTTVSLHLSQSFTVTLPADFELDDLEETGTYVAYAPVSATVHLLNSNNVLSVSVKGTTKNDDLKTWILTETNPTSGSTPKTLEYGVRLSDYSDQGHVDFSSTLTLLESGAKIIEINSPVTRTKYLHFKLKSTDIQVGNYADTLTFTVAVGPA